MSHQQPRAIRFHGGTPFVALTTHLWGRIDKIGEWLVPGEHLVHPDDASMFAELLDLEGVAYSTSHEYLDEALYRISERD